MHFPRAERRVAVSGHDEYWRGWFHGWAGLSEHPTAIVEDEQGRARVVEFQKITFLDPIGEATEANR